MENCHEAVKTQEEHDKILNSLSKRNSIPNRGKGQTHTFTGLIKCVKCGHSHTFYTCNGKVIMKPCWYVDPLGNKCRNGGISISVIEEMILTEINHYKDDILSMEIKEDKGMSASIDIQIKEKMRMIKKYEKAKNNLLIAFEIEEITKEQWLERKHARETEIYQLKNEIELLNNQLKDETNVTEKERKENLTKFFDDIVKVTTSSERNSLYKTIINSIIWLKDGDNVEMKINFK